ncbi:uncharacterized protein G2W53_002843 [Senna tora]|uniref:Uncharacterized protein n=1 Tax=Senna tora TaxID=362788 RepID=A0A834X9G8_9FABA|nr:uncharacterized protein G2W53_002843 [Senna tora]
MIEIEEKVTRSIAGDATTHDSSCQIKERIVHVTLHSIRLTILKVAPTDSISHSSA